MLLVLCPGFSHSFSGRGYVFTDPHLCFPKTGINSSPPELVPFLSWCIWLTITHWNHTDTTASDLKGVWFKEGLQESFWQGHGTRWSLSSCPTQAILGFCAHSLGPLLMLWPRCVPWHRSALPQLLANTLWAKITLGAKNSDFPMPSAHLEMSLCVLAPRKATSALCGSQ